MPSIFNTHCLNCHLDFTDLLFYLEAILTIPSLSATTMNTKLMTTATTTFLLITVVVVVVVGVGGGSSLLDTIDWAETFSNLTKLLSSLKGAQGALCALAFLFILLRRIGWFYRRTYGSGGAFGD